MLPENLLHPLKLDVVGFKEEDHDYHFRARLTLRASSVCDLTRRIRQMHPVRWLVIPRVANTENISPVIRPIRLWGFVVTAIIPAPTNNTEPRAEQ